MTECPVELIFGRNDAFNDLVSRGDGRGGFKPLGILESGLYVPGNGKAMVKLAGNRNNYLLATSQNRGALKIFELKTGGHLIPLHPEDRFATVTFKDGRTAGEEFYFGAFFCLSPAD